MYSLAANQGNVKAQVALGYCYMNGQVEERNYAKASEWFERAAQHGDAEAARRLVYCRKYGGYMLLKDEKRARSIADQYGIDYDSV
jgi:TPR repeat protein